MFNIHKLSWVSRYPAECPVLDTDMGLSSFREILFLVSNKQMITDVEIPFNVEKIVIT